jgi:hypothetical protein
MYAFLVSTMCVTCPAHLIPLELIIFIPEDGDSMLLRKTAIYLRVYTVSQPRTTSLFFAIFHTSLALMFIAWNRVLLEKLILRSAGQETSLFREPEGSLPCSQDPAASPSPEPDESSPHPDTLFPKDPSTRRCTRCQCLPRGVSLCKMWGEPSAIPLFLPVFNVHEQVTRLGTAAWAFHAQRLCTRTGLTGKDKGILQFTYQ